MGDAYPRYDAQNNKSTKTAAGWSQAKPVYLLSDKATIWAYYPYNQAVADGTKVPVPINAGTSVDYMWGKSTNQVSVIETDAVIPMKHALSQLVIRLKVSPEYHKAVGLDPETGDVSQQKSGSFPRYFVCTYFTNLSAHAASVFPGVHPRRRRPILCLTYFILLQRWITD